MWKLLLVMILFQVEIFANLDIDSLNRKMSEIYNYSVKLVRDDMYTNKNKLVYEKENDEEEAFVEIVCEDGKMRAFAIDIVGKNDLEADFSEVENITSAVIMCNSNLKQNVILRSAVLNRESSKHYHVDVIDDLAHKMISVEYK